MVVCVKHLISSNSGGFAVVFITKPNGSNSGNVRYALKRLYVNDQVDLNAAKREIQIAVSIDKVAHIDKPI